jgi:soluble lytic murein transglycosylase-like protein
MTARAAMHRRAFTSPKTAGPTAVALCAALAAAGAGAVGKGGAPGWGHLIDAASPREQVEWGQRYEHGEGVAKSPYRAAALYCAAAEKGDALAAYQLGWLYANGRGLPRDDALAAAWFRQAAARGDAYARRMLDRLPGVRKVEASCRLPPAGGGAGSTQLASLSAVSPAERKAVEESVHAMAPGFGLDPHLVLAVIAAESAFDKTAVSPKGAQGLMQLMPQTASRFGVTNAFDPEQNLRGGMTYLAWLIEQFRGDLDLALAGYNAGEGAVEQYRGIPPYQETREYVRRIRSAYRGPGSAVALAAKSDGG